MLRDNCWNLKGTGTDCPDFRTFLKLRCLTISAGILAGSLRRPGFPYGPTQAPPLPRIIDILPPSIEVVVLDDSAGMFEDSVEELFEGFSRLQPERLPNLRAFDVSHIKDQEQGNAMWTELGRFGRNGEPFQWWEGAVKTYSSLFL